MPDDSLTADDRCAACGAAAAGRFCANCGAGLASGNCSFCDASLAPDARFCHRCGNPVAGTATRMVTTASAPTATSAQSPSAAAPGTRGSTLPWAIAGLAVIAFVALLAGQRFRSGDSAAPGNGQAPFQPLGAASATSAGDISDLSPRERADRLFDRVMRLSAEGKTDSVQFFAPMALTVYQTLGPLDDDLRYDFGRVAEAVGRPEIARAQADSILARNPDHLLGLSLALRAATTDGDATREREFARRLIAAEPAEIARALPEYQRHATDIRTALDHARTVK